MNSSLFDLLGRIALITGATRGIGRAIAERMAEAGAQVIVSSEDAVACDTTVAELRAKGHDAVAIRCDVSDKSDVEALVARALKLCGRIAPSSHARCSRIPQ